MFFFTLKALVVMKYIKDYLGGRMRKHPISSPIPSPQSQATDTKKWGRSLMFALFGGKKKERKKEKRGGGGGGTCAMEGR